MSGAAELTLGVVEQQRGRGIGISLLDRGIKWADCRGCRKVYNSLPATNEAAIEFLEAYGCEIEAVRPNHYELDGELVDEVQVARRLD